MTLPAWSAGLLRRGAGDFANSSAGGKFVTAAGQWLDSPVAVLKASDGSINMTSALLALSEPHYDSTANTLTFKVRSS